MIHKPNIVVIVQEGTFNPEEYDSWIAIVRHAIEGATVPGDKQGDDPKRLAVVEVVSSWQEAEERAKQNEIDILIFVSVNMVEVARGFRQRYKNLTVYVMTGVDPEGEPYIVPKGILGLDTLQQIAHKH